MTKLKDWHEFPQWTPQPLAAKFPNLEPAGIDLMQQMFVYDPAKRITVSTVARTDRLQQTFRYDPCQVHHGGRQAL